MKRRAFLEDSVVRHINHYISRAALYKHPITWHQLEEWSGFSRSVLQRNTVIRMAYVEARAEHMLSSQRSPTAKQTKSSLMKTKSSNGAAK